MEINFSGFSCDAGVPGCTAGRLLSWVFDLVGFYGDGLGQ